MDRREVEMDDAASKGDTREVDDGWHRGCRITTTQQSIWWDGDGINQEWEMKGQKDIGVGIMNALRIRIEVVFLIILQIELSLSHFSNRTLYNWRVVIRVVPVQTFMVTVELNRTIMSRPSFLGRSEANFSAASSSVHVLTPRPWLHLSSFTFLLHDACHLLLDGIRPLLFKLIVVYCPTRHSHSSSLIHVLASSNLIVVFISLRSPPLRRCPSSLPRIWLSCNIILVIHLCLDDNLSRLVKLDSRVYFLIHLCPWWYRHLLINDVRPLPLEFDCRVYLTGHSFPLRWYMSSPLRI